MKRISTRSSSVWLSKYKKFQIADSSQGSDFLTTVFILGNNGSELQSLVLSQLSQRYRVTFVDKDGVISKGNGYELLFVATGKISVAQVDNSAVILEKNALTTLDAFPESTCVIAFSENEKQIRMLKNSSCKIYTCGFHEQDTFSYTSLCDDNVVVSLNREITALSGKKIQPLEFPLEIPKGADVYSVMAFTALRLLLDDFNSEIGDLY